MLIRVALVVIAAALAAGPAGAQRLPVTAVPSHYDLSFDVNLPRATFDGVETIRVEVPRPTRAIVLHALDLVLHEASVTTGARSQQATISLNRADQTATLTVPEPVEGPAALHIRYSGTLNDRLRGFYLSRDSGRRYAVTQFESTDARRAFPSFDEPVFKATFDLQVTVDRGDTAISNGRVVADTEAPGGRHTLRFATTPKMSTYLVAMVVGDFECLEGEADGVPLRICATRGKKELGRIALETAPQVLRFFHGYFSIKYPFGKLDMIAVPDFAAGAMENTAAIIYREADLLADERQASLPTRKRIASIIAHELAHQWFGNLVTMQWWDDIWLNEGFATWMASRPLAALRPDWNIPVDEALDTQTALGLDGLKSTRPIHARVETPEEIEATFDAIAYEKGAAVLRMVERYVGADTFRRGINAYLEAHAYGNATSDDFWSTMARVSGQPIDAVLPTFVNRPGAPLIGVDVSCRGNTTQVTLAQERFLMDAPGGDASVAPPWQIPVCLKGDRSQVVACSVLTAARATLDFGTACLPWVFVNAGAYGYYRSEYSPGMLRLLAPEIGASLTPPERLAIAADEWALVRAGRHTVAEYLTLAAGYGREHTSGVLASVVERLGFVREYLTTAAARPRLEAFVRDLVRALYDEVGFEVRTTDDEERKALRATVLSALGEIGGDDRLVARAREVLDRALGGGPPLDPSTARVVVTLAAAHGDRALYDALMSAAERARSPNERYLYLFAAADFRDPAILQRALEHALTPALRSQDTALYFARMMNAEAARPLAWAFLKAHWKELEPKLAIAGGDVNLARSLSSFCDAATRDDIRIFFSVHRLPSATRTLAQTIERIDNCVRLRDTQLPVVTAWLDAR
jgi:aminopeptidase N